ncbi:MAG TPA: PqqD family protein [Trebonia sp.]|nr:PqqD family protein [Trebonia sp.]
MTSPRQYTADMVPRRSLDARVRKIRGKLYVATGSLAFELDEVAEFIFRHVDGSATAAMIAGQVASAYGVAVQEAEADVLDLLGELAGQGIVE